MHKYEKSSNSINLYLYKRISIYLWSEMISRDRWPPENSMDDVGKKILQVFSLQGGHQDFYKTQNSLSTVYKTLLLRSKIIFQQNEMKDNLKLAWGKLTFIISTALVCSKDKIEETRSGTEIQISGSLYTITDRAATAPLLMWGDEPERYPIIWIVGNIIGHYMLWIAFSITANNMLEQQVDRHNLKMQLSEEIGIS